MNTYNHGDRVEFCWKGDIWLKGVIYAVYRDSVLILADQPSQIYDRPFCDVRKLQ
jgi:hypothetical protein